MRTATVPHPTDRLTRCSFSSALAKAGKKVLHLDANEYYGSEDASFSLDELIEWAGRSHTRFTNIECSVRNTADLSDSLAKQSRRFALSLRPHLLPAQGTLVNALIKSGVSNYVGFRLLEAVALCYIDGGQTTLRRVPATKEEVFKTSDLTLLDKRRLVKFLLFAAGNYQDSDLFRCEVLHR